MAKKTRDGDNSSDIDFLSMVQSRMRSVPTTDDEWAAHDALIAAQRAEDERARHRGTLMQMRTVLGAQGTPQRLLDLAAGPDFRSELPAVVALSAWDWRSRPIAIVSGQTGTGKTVAGIRMLLDEGARAPLFMQSSEFERRGRYDRVRSDVIRRATAMVLDDLGGEHADAKKNFLTDLANLIDRWCGSRGWFVVTTNMTGKVFRERVLCNRRIKSRLDEAGKWIEIHGKDLRSER